MIKKVIFDFDGTIADSNAILRCVINDVTDKFSLPKFTDEEYTHLCSIPLKDAIKECNVKWYDVPKYMLEGWLFFMKRIHTVPLFEGMHDALNILHNNNVQMSIISSNASENIAKFMNINNLNFFDEIISSKRLFKKHRFIKTFLKMKKLNPSEVLYVGDEVRDIEACKKANINIIAATWGFDNLDHLMNADPEHIAQYPSDIVDIVNSYA